MARALAIVHQRDAGPGVFAEAASARGVALETWHPAEGEPAPADLATYDAVLTFGGAMHADQEEPHPWLRQEKNLLTELLEAGTPLLGVCLGSQLLAEAGGGAARRARDPEIGWLEVELTSEGRADPLLGALAPRFEAFQWHSYEAAVPPAAVELARSPVCLQAYRLADRAWGIQFHAEVSGVDAAAWIADYRSDEDAVRIGLDPVPLARETAEKIGDWNAVGRGICERFLDVAYSGVR
jgi:GMP synthase (glutamine-hydrolysing)